MSFLALTGIPDSIDALSEASKASDSSLLFILFFIVATGGIFLLYSFFKIFSSHKSIMATNERISHVYSLSIDSLEKINKFVVDSEMRILEKHEALSEHMRSSEEKFVLFLKDQGERVRADLRMDHKAQSIEVKNVNNKINSIEKKIDSIIDQNLQLDHKSQDMVLKGMLEKINLIVSKIKAN